MKTLSITMATLTNGNKFFTYTRKDAEKISKLIKYQLGLDTVLEAVTYFDSEELKGYYCPSDEEKYRKGWLRYLDVEDMLPAFFTSDFNAFTKEDEVSKKYFCSAESAYLIKLDGGYLLAGDAEEALSLIFALTDADVSRFISEKDKITIVFTDGQEVEVSAILRPISDEIDERLEAMEKEMRRESAQGIINLTQHHASPEQLKSGVFEPDDKETVKSLLTFVGMPTMEEVKKRAEALAEIAVQENAEYAMIGGAPYLMAPLHMALLRKEIQPLYAFSERVSVEKVEGGETIKTSVFKHVGFIG